MLWTSVLILMIPWGLGWINGDTMAGWSIHVLLSSVIQSRRPRDRMEKIAAGNMHSADRMQRRFTE
jgi:hypothetical protein